MKINCPIKNKKLKIQLKIKKHFPVKTERNQKRRKNKSDFVFLRDNGDAKGGGGISYKRGGEGKI